MSNYQMTAHIYSSTPATSRAVFPGSLGNATSPDYGDNNYSICYNGFVIVSPPNLMPLGFYLAPVPSNPKNEVDVWINTQQWHGQPLVQVVQTGGSFTPSSDNSLSMPLTGYIQLDIYANTLTQVYRKPNNSYWSPPS
jgi:hypothetical protein